MDNVPRHDGMLSPDAQRFREQSEQHFIEKTRSIPARDRKKRTQDLLKNDVVRQRLAKVIAENGFRSQLEDIHAGTFPSSEAGDGSDIKVVSPYGEIPWNRLGRISDTEMKQINKGAVDYLYNMLCNLLDGNLWTVLEDLSNKDPLPHWDAPNQDHP